MTGQTILVADDDAAIRTVLSQALTRLGYSVRSTGNAATLWHWISGGNGELVIGLKNGVEYVLRFGNISGLSEKEESADGSADKTASSASVNRYLLVTTRVNEARIPRPKLKVIPQTLEDLQPKKEVVEEPAKQESDQPAKATEAEDANKTPKGRPSWWFCS